MTKAQQEIKKMVGVRGRRFIVYTDMQGRFLRVYERKLGNQDKPKHLQFLYNQGAWHHNHNAVPKRGIIAEAMAAASAS